MFKLFTLTVSSLSLASLPSDTRAQDKPAALVCDVVVPSPECWKEFEDWQKRDGSWRERKNQVGNRATDKHKRRIVQPERPMPPRWVWQCDDLQQAGRPVASPVCQALQTYLDYDWTQHVTGFRGSILHKVSMPATTVGEDRGLKAYLLKNVHLDGAWTNANNNRRSYGFFGTHVTVAFHGRIYFWAGPGILLVRNPLGQLKMRYTYGLDVYLGRVNLWMLGQRPVYLTVAKTFARQQSMDLINDPSSGETMIGVSMTLKK
jgi:hypothetical protein